MVHRGVESLEHVRDGRVNGLAGALEHWSTERRKTRCEGGAGEVRGAREQRPLAPSNLLTNFDVNPPSFDAKRKVPKQCRPKIKKARRSRRSPSSSGGNGWQIHIQMLPLPHADHDDVGEWQVCHFLVVCRLLSGARCWVEALKALGEQPAAACAWIPWLCLASSSSSEIVQFCNPTSDLYLQLASLTSNLEPDL